MENFRFKNSTEIIFGRNRERQVGLEINNYHNSADKVLLHYGGGSIKRYGTYETIVKSLEEADLDIVELGGVKPNPRLGLVNEGIELCREKNVDFILAVGGGSVIDSAKAISIGVPYEGDVWDFYKGEREIKSKLPVGVVLTIAAAGSEASHGSVITNEEEELKRPCNSRKLRPEFAILNPKLTYTLPEFQTACGAVDIFSHVMERYFTNTEGVGLIDRLCESVMRTVAANAPKVIEEPENYDARAQLMWGSTLAHNDLLGTGREEDWASHRIEHELSGIYDIAHGAGLAIIFPAWMKYVYQHDVPRFAQFADRVWGVETNYSSLEETALKGIARTESFFSKLGLPTHLSDVDIDDSRVEEMAEKRTKDGPVGNFVELDKDDVLEIYKMAL